MDEERIGLDFNLVQKILKQLITSDGIEVTDPRLIKQKIFYIDNVSVIEELERKIVEHFYVKLLREHGHVNFDDLFKYYLPTYINYGKLYSELEHKGNEMDDKSETESVYSLDKFL